MFWLHDKLVDIMTYFLISWQNVDIILSQDLFWMLWRTFVCHDELFEVMTNLLSSWRVFDIFTNILTSWRVYNIMTNFLFDKHLNFKTYVVHIDAMELFDDMRHFLTSWRSVRRETNFLCYGMFFTSWRTLFFHDVFSDDMTRIFLFWYILFNYFVNKI